MSLAERYTKSIELTARTRKVTPGGSQTSSKAPMRFPEGAYPAYLASGSGANLWDVDGNYYVDFICGLGAVPLGYFHPGVSAAIQTQLETGLLSASLPTALEEQVAARLVKIIPCAADNGQVRFVKTGSEACAAAVRIARRVTGRDLVIVVGYHGWHDWVQVTSDPHPGIPDALAGATANSDNPPLVMRVSYNDTQAIADIMRDYMVAAVMLEPMLLEAPRGNYLSDVVTLCTLHGALSIFDEVVTGFRWARAGGQEYFNVTPDLSVFGKGLANGMPLACIIGPERFMRNADVISETFGGECLSLAAANAVLDVYEETPEPGEQFFTLSLPVNRQWLWGVEFYMHCLTLGIPMTGWAIHPKILYKGEEMALFLQETARRGLIMHPAGLNISAALTPEDMDLTYRALKGAVEAMKDKVPLEGLVLDIWSSGMQCASSLPMPALNLPRSYPQETIYDELAPCPGPTLLLLASPVWAEEYPDMMHCGGVTQDAEGWVRVTCPMELEPYAVRTIYVWFDREIPAGTVPIYEVTGAAYPIIINMIRGEAQGVKRIYTKFRVFNVVALEQDVTVHFLLPGGGN